MLVSLGSNAGYTNEALISAIGLFLFNFHSWEIRWNKELRYDHVDCGYWGTVFPEPGVGAASACACIYRDDTNIVFMMYSSRKYSLQSDLNLPDIYFCISPTGLALGELLDK